MTLKEDVPKTKRGLWNVLFFIITKGEMLNENNISKASKYSFGKVS